MENGRDLPPAPLADERIALNNGVGAPVQAPRIQGSLFLNKINFLILNFTDSHHLFVFLLNFKYARPVLIPAPFRLSPQYFSHLSYQLSIQFNLISI